MESERKINKRVSKFFPFKEKCHLLVKIFSTRYGFTKPIKIWGFLLQAMIKYFGLKKKTSGVK